MPKGTHLHFLLLKTDHNTQRNPLVWNHHDLKIQKCKSPFLSVCVVSGPNPMFSTPQTKHGEHDGSVGFESTSRFGHHEGGPLFESWGVCLGINLSGLPLFFTTTTPTTFPMLWLIGRDVWIEPGNNTERFRFSASCRFENISFFSLFSVW
jgi:hypothetical protein